VIPSSHDIAACRVLVVGDAMLDRYWYGSVDRISPEAPVPVVRVQRDEERLGGAANVAVNVRRLGAASSFLTVVGKDNAAERIHSLLLRENVESQLGCDEELPTTVKLRVIGHAQQLIRIDFEQSPTEAALIRLLGDYEIAVRSCDIVVFSDYGKGVLTRIRDMIALAKEAGKPILVDPKGSDYEKYRGATVLTPNRAELERVVGAWTDEADLRIRAQRLRKDLGLSVLLLTRSEEGMTLFEGDDESGVTNFVAQAREVFDVTGAGDTVIATLSVMLGCGLPMAHAVRIANHAAGMVVSKFGTSSVSYKELFAVPIT
jgi:rfaE bifunctional protein kinase chain/domain